MSNEIILPVKTDKGTLVESGVLHSGVLWCTFSDGTITVEGKLGMNHPVPLRTLEVVDVDGSLIEDPAVARRPFTNFVTELILKYKDETGTFPDLR